MNELLKKELENDLLSVRTFFCSIIVICFFNIPKEAICSSRLCVNLTSSFCWLSQYFCSVITSQLYSSICLVSLLISISSGPNSCPCTRARFEINQVEAAGALVYSITAEGQSNCCMPTKYFNYTVVLSVSYLLPPFPMSWMGLIIPELTGINGTEARKVLRLSGERAS